MPWHTVFHIVPVMYAFKLWLAQKEFIGKQLLIAF